MANDKSKKLSPAKLGKLRESLFGNDTEVLPEPDENISRCILCKYKDEPIASRQCQFCINHNESGTYYTDKKQDKFTLHD